MLLDQMPDPAGKALEAPERVDVDGSNCGMLFDDGRVLAKAQINDLSSGIGGGVQEGQYEPAIIVKVRDPPDHVIADSQTIENLIQPGQAGGDPVGRVERFFAAHG
jgi:hypothetical protein